MASDSFDLQQTDRAARKIQRFWRSSQDRGLFRLLQKIVQKAESCLTPAVLRQLTPPEAQLLTDPSMHCKVRFRLYGPQFPPVIVFKIFLSGSRQHYISGKKIFRPSNQVTSQSCGMMGNRKFLELLVSDEVQSGCQSVTEAADVICMRDFMQYSSHLDELPAYLGGRSNSWRTLNLSPVPGLAHVQLGSGGSVGTYLRPGHQRAVQDGSTAGKVGARGGTRADRSPVAPPSSVAFVPISHQQPPSSRTSSTASTSWRSDKFHHAVSRKMHKLYLTGYLEPSSTTGEDHVSIPTDSQQVKTMSNSQQVKTMPHSQQGKTMSYSQQDDEWSPRVKPTELDTPTMPRLAKSEEVGFNRSLSPLSSHSDWEEEEEEVERLCDWSRQLGEFKEDNKPGI